MEALFDMNDRTLTLVYEELKSEGDILTAKINRYGRIIPIEGIKFGFTFFIDSFEVKKAEWPSPGINYKKTDQDVLARYQLAWKPDNNIKIDIWLLDIFGILHENSIEFIAPRPPKPYPSWIWADGYWDSPIPVPDITGGKLYDWNEDNMMWVEIQE